MTIIEKIILSSILLACYLGFFLFGYFYARRKFMLLSKQDMENIRNSHESLLKQYIDSMEKKDGHHL